jgi:hypothetical protein
MPLFQLLIRFPGLEKEEHLATLAHLALRMMLSEDRGQDDLLGLVKEVNDAQVAANAVHALDQELPSSKKLRKSLPKRLGDANTLADRHTLLLYWLLRHREAKDLSYENVASKDGESSGRLRPGEEKTLCDNVEPEAQHIVPYSRLAQVYGIAKRGRVSRHLCNNIGNLTYISHDLNTLTGLASEPANLKHEPDENRRAHFLDSPSVLKSYHKAAFTVHRGEVKASFVKASFEQFSKNRRQLIAEGFAGWVEELAANGLDLERMEPEARFDPTDEDRVRQEDYPDTVEDALLDLIASGAYFPKKEDPIIKVRGTAEDDGGFKATLEEGRIILNANEKSAIFRKVSEYLSKMDPTIGGCPVCGTSKRVVLLTDAEHESSTTEVIEFLAARCR